MAVLQKIRVKFGLAISIIIALALLSFIIDPNTLGSALQSMSSKYDVGQIAGKRVSYTDFQENVDKFTTIHQIATGSSVQNEQTQIQIRNAAWQDYLDRYMLTKNARNAGVRVGEDEMVNLTTGDNISPVLAQNPAFQDPETGLYSPEALRSFVQNTEADESGRGKLFWNYLQNSVLTQKYYDKYGALFINANVLPKVFADKAVAEANTTATVEYVMVPFNYNDSTVTVSSSEIKAYYNAHKKNYKQNAGRDIEYVVYEVVPSEADITAANEDIEGRLAEFGSTGNMKAFLLRNSERSYSEHWYTQNELASNLSSDIAEFVFSGSEGVSPVYKSGNVFRAVKTMASAMVPDSVYVKHILLQGANAQKQADSLCAVVAKGGNFSNLAALYSVDKSSADGGELGNLGWFTQTYTIPGFESVVTADLNKPFVLNTQYGSHVVLVSKRTKPVAKKQVAVLEKTALASQETFNDFYAKANRFASITGGTYEGYKRAVDSTGVYSHPMNNVSEATSSYGAISQAKEITRWVFDNKPGKASNIITVNNNYFFVVAVKAAREEGYRSVNDAAPEINEILKSEKLRELTKAQVAAKIQGMTSLEQVAEACKASTNTREDVAFNTTGAPAVEPALLGAASVAPEGQICGPVAGEACVYVFKVSNRQTGSFFTEEDAVNNEKQKARYSAQMIVPVMMEYDDVKDNRARFF
ncbi:MAG: SurA N-terminal domain-containing protein [Bacteroidales bacterium]|nr:SurA N-terminal domain-containing protein [Bacteroidales bacterium]